MNKKNMYTKSFYSAMKSNSQKATNESSAELIVPYILELFPKASSVIDFGGAIGIWAKEFIKNGVEDIHVIDGAWVDKEQLEIPKECFETYDFSRQKYSAEKKYDIAMSLEVAEHIEPENADLFVQSITESSDIVIFSAAIPAQGGSGHVNERPQSYWKKKFEACGYTAIDPIRGKFEKNNKVQVHYKQNMLVYVKNFEQYSEITKYVGNNFVTDIVCPEYAYLLHETNTWKHLFFVQWTLLKKMVRKLIHI